MPAGSTHPRRPSPTTRLGRSELGRVLLWSHVVAAGIIAVVVALLAIFPLPIPFIHPTMAHAFGSSFMFLVGPGAFLSLVINFLVLKRIAGGVVTTPTGVLIVTEYVCLAALIGMTQPWVNDLRGLGALAAPVAFLVLAAVVVGLAFAVLVRGARLSSPAPVASSVEFRP